MGESAVGIDLYSILFAQEMKFIAMKFLFFRIFIFFKMFQADGNHFLQIHLSNPRGQQNLLALLNSGCVVSTTGTYPFWQYFLAQSSNYTVSSLNDLSRKVLDFNIILFICFSITLEESKFHQHDNFPITRNVKSRYYAWHVGRNSSIQFSFYSKLFCQREKK